MDDIDTSRLSEDQQYEMAEAAMVAFGLEEVSPAELLEDGFLETIQYGRYDILDYQEPKDGKPSSVLCEITYSAPYDDGSNVSKNIDLYKRQFRVFMSSAREGMQALRDNPQAWPKDAEGKLFKPLEGEARFMEPWAESCGLPQDGRFYADVYAQPDLTAIGRMPRLVDGALIQPNEWMNLVRHTGMRQEVFDRVIKYGVNRVLRVSGFGVDVSGQSEVRTFFGRVRAEGKAADDIYKGVERNIIATMTDNPDCEPLLLHSAKWQKKLGQDAPEDKRIPTPEIGQMPHRYYGNELYYTQNLANGAHFNLEDTTELGKALGRIHNYPSNEAELPPVTSVLDEGKLINSAKLGLRDAAKRTQAGKVHGTTERMEQSIRGRLLERFTFEEIQQKEPDLCRQVGLTRAAASRHDLIRQRKAEEDAILPQGLCHGDMHAKNLLAYKDGSINIIDFQLTGKGVFADELTLVLYFFCVGAEGKLDPERTRTFFDEYRKARSCEDKSTGNIPLTQQELSVIPQRLSRLAQRQTHPVWEMLNDSLEARYAAFAERNHALPEQIEAIMQDGGIERFAREFAGVELDSLPEYTASHSRKHASREAQRKNAMPAKAQEGYGEFITRADKKKKGNDRPLVGSGI